MINYIFHSKEYCHFCLEEKTENYICDNCFNRLEFINGTKELDNGKCYYPLFYNNFIKEIIKKFKYSKDSYLVKALAQILYKHIKDKNLEFDYITYIPMYPADEFDRGYNQSELLAIYLAKFTKNSIIKLSKKIKSTKHQNKLDKKFRMLNLDGAFRVSKKFQIDGKKVLIVDDLVTTGTTFNKLSEEIKKVYNVDLVFLAITSGRYDEGEMDD